MFLGQMKESSEDGVGRPPENDPRTLNPATHSSVLWCAAEIPIPNIDPPVFLSILEFLYTDQIPSNMTTDTAVELLIMAERYLLYRLKALCEDAIRKSVDCVNVVSILLTAKKHK